MTTTDKQTTLNTTIHEYYYDLDKPKDAKAYESLCARMKEAKTKCFETCGGSSHYQPELDGKTITLETKHLFSNQWNTAPIDGISDIGLRVFDWAMDYVANKKIKQGHWLAMTHEMRAIRALTLICGYCGKNYPPDATVSLSDPLVSLARNESPKFCTACLDSTYLKEEDLHLLRLMPTSLDWPKRTALTDSERAELIPVYVERQTTGTNSRAAAKAKKTRENVILKYQKTTRNAKTEHDGLLWLLDRGLSIENVIYYSHSGKFSFGWMSPVSEAVTSKLVDILCEFPFEYEIQSQSRGTISGTE